MVNDKKATDIVLWSHDMNPVPRMNAIEPRKPKNTNSIKIYLIDNIIHFKLS